MSFDETNLVPNAGLLPAALLAERIGLAELVDSRLQLARQGSNSGSRREQPAHRAVPQQRQVIDRVGPSDHTRNQRRDLQVRVDPTGLGQLKVLSDQVLQTLPAR